MRGGKIITMAKLTEKERVGFEDIMEQDMGAISSKMMNQIKDFYAKAREEVLKSKGWDKLIIEKKELQDSINKKRDRMHDIETEMHKEDLRPEQVTEMGGKPNKYDHFEGANFHGIPVKSQFDYEIVEYIRNHIDLNVPAKFLHDLGRAAMRALAMSGTFEEARNAYDEFYSLDFRKYGVDIPPRLQDVKNDIENLQYAQSTLALPVDSQGDFESIEQRDKDKKSINYVG